VLDWNRKIKCEAGDPHMSDTHARIAFLFYDHCADEDACWELAKAEDSIQQREYLYIRMHHEVGSKIRMAGWNMSARWRSIPSIPAPIPIKRSIERRREQYPGENK
jgi:hypothetical protein